MKMVSYFLLLRCAKCKCKQLQEGLVADAVADERLPIAFGARRARIVPLPHASKPECVLFVEHELGNLLIAADALQHHVPPHRASWAAFALMWWMGFFGECVGQSPKLGSSPILSTLSTCYSHTSN